MAIRNKFFIRRGWNWIISGRSERAPDDKSSERLVSKSLGPLASEFRSNNIDALRLILSLLVLFSHSYPLATGNYDNEPLAWFSGRQITFGEVAVDWFFVLSGYLIAQSWERSSSVVSFLRKRAFRICPGYLVSVAICLWVVVPMSSAQGLRVYTWNAIAENVWRIFLFRKFSAPESFVTNPFPCEVNGSLWTIPFELWCYFGMVLLGVTSLIRRRWLICGFFVASLIASFVFIYFDVRTQGKFLGVIFGNPRSWSRLLPFYLSGLVAYLFRDWFRWDGRLALLASAGLILGLFVPLAIPIVLPTLGTYLLFYLAFTTDLRWHDAARFGDFSYGIYLFSYPIQQLFMMRLGHAMDPLHLFALSLPPTILAGVLSWYFVESRFLRRSIGDQTIKRTEVYHVPSRLARNTEASVLD